MTAVEIAAIAAAIVTVIASLTTAIVTIINAFRQSENKRDTDKKLEVLHEQGNSNLTTARALSEALGVEKGKQIGSSNAKAEGREEGIKEERANPMVPAINVNVPAIPLPLPVTVVEPDMTPSKLEPKK